MTNETATKAKMKVKAGLNWAPWGATLLALSSGAAGCADHVQSAVAACPCDQGVCCTSGVCAADQRSCTQATQALSSESAGRWTGYIENANLSSSSDALDLTLEVESDGSLSGQMIFGSGSPATPAIDGSVGWPTGYFTNLGDGKDGNLHPINGFPYHLVNVRWTALRLRFETELAEPWGPWCQLQQSYVSAVDPSVAACVQCPLGGNVDECHVQNAGGQPIAVDSEKATACAAAGACDCTSAGCDAGTTVRVSFDIALRGNDGDGSLADDNLYNNSIVGTHNVRLIRASN